jgi:hypothetical protein
MQTTVTAADGSVHCPKCNATSFTPQRTTKAKLSLGLVSLVAAPKLRCNGCGEYLKPGNTPATRATPARAKEHSPAELDKIAASRAKIDARMARRANR